MPDEFPRAGKIKSVFAKAANRELVPDNFGTCLLTAVREGLCTKDDLASLLGTDHSRIRKAGDNLKPREIANISRALIAQPVIGG